MEFVNGIVEGERSDFVDEHTLIRAPMTMNLDVMELSFLGKQRSCPHNQKTND